MIPYATCPYDIKIPYPLYSHMDTTWSLIGTALILALIISVAWVWGRMKEKG